MRLVEYLTQSTIEPGQYLTDEGVKIRATAIGVVFEYPDGTLDTIRYVTQIDDHTPQPNPLPTV